MRPSPEGTWPHSIGRNFTGLYLRLGEIRREIMSAGMDTRRPKPSIYIIGENCAAVSLANSSVAGDISYKNLALSYVTSLNKDLARSLGWLRTSFNIFERLKSALIKSRNSSIVRSEIISSS